MHEMSHGVGPGFITVNGQKTEVKKELKETYSKLEECKADILGMYNNIFMIKKGVYTEEFAKETYVTFLAGIFRSVRFGVNEAHGAGNAIIYNYLLEKGGYEFDNNTEKVSVNFDKVYPALRDLAEKILTIQATGDYEASKELIEKYAVNSPTMDKLRSKLSKLPVDIRPIFQIEEHVK
jgi:Zn-dependent M32 family carboxypeptidase